MEASGNDVEDVRQDRIVWIREHDASKAMREVNPNGGDKSMDDAVSEPLIHCVRPLYSGHRAGLA